MVYRRAASRRTRSPELVIRTTGTGKLVFGLVVGAIFTCGGALALLVATAVDEVLALLVTLVIGLACTIVGIGVGVGSVVESLKPIHLRVEGNELVLRQRRLTGLPSLESIDLQAITRVYVETRTTHGENGPNHSFRVAIDTADGGTTPIGGYHYMSDLDEARELAFRIQQLIAPPPDALG